MRGWITSMAATVTLGWLVAALVTGGCGLCVPEGESFTYGKGGHPVCCPGMTEVSLELIPGDDPQLDTTPDGCTEAPGVMNESICLPCGDGVCGDGEHYCNCPEDCTEADWEGE